MEQGLKKPPINTELQVYYETFHWWSSARLDLDNLLHNYCYIWDDDDDEQLASWMKFMCPQLIIYTASGLVMCKKIRLLFCQLTFSS